MTSKRLANFHFGPVGRALFILTIMGVTFAYASLMKYRQREVFEGTSNSVVLPKMPDFLATQLPSQTPFSLPDLEQLNPGAVVVHFWGTWCAPCEEEFPALLKLTEKLIYRNIVFLLIAVNDESLKVQKFIKKYPVHSPNVKILLDTEQNLMKKFGTIKVPETFVFDAQLKSYKKWVGPQAWEKSYFQEVLTYVANLYPVSNP